MWLPRFRFTLGQLITFIAALAVLLALLRTPIGPMLLATGLVLGGFALDRARGRPGILGAMLAGLIGSLGLGAVILLEDLHDGRLMFGGAAPLFILPAFGMVGLAFGLLVGFLALTILFLGGGSAQVAPPTEPVGPITWRGFEDRGLPHPRSGADPR
jgi:hypothetical protein